MNTTIKRFIDTYVEEIKEKNAAIFAGAGLSVPAGFVDWKNLLRPIADELEVDIHKEDDLVSLAQYHYNEHGRNRARINEIIFNEFSKDCSVTENHKILARLPINTFWTTNYDNLIERSLKEEGKVPDVKYTVRQLALTKKKRDAIVYKMHGDKEHPSNAVVLKDDYESYHLKKAPFITNLSGDLVSKTFLFIGFSFTDPNLDYILSRIRSRYNENQRRHYCFVKELKKEEFKDEEEFQYRKRKQELFINDLLRFNIITLKIKEYSEITDILKIIEKRMNKSNVFISGSANEFGNWGEDKAKKFIHHLTENLIKSDFNIISGFGVGVGSLVISGALEELYINQGKFDDNRLLLRPFPQKTDNNLELKQLWYKYRMDMISRAGISIFVFGNKIVNNEIVNADGVISEFNIAQEKENIIIPVGVTGYVAREIWDKVNNNLDDFYPITNKQIRTLFDSLNNNGIEINVLISNIIKLINLLKGAI